MHAVCMRCGAPAHYSQRIAGRRRPGPGGRHRSLRGALPPLLRALAWRAPELRPTSHRATRESRAAAGRPGRRARRRLRPRSPWLGGPLGCPRSASTSTCTVTDDVPSLRVVVQKLTRSPTKTGAWKTTSRMATVTILPAHVAMRLDRARLVDVGEDDAAEDGAQGVGVLGHHDDADGGRAEARVGFGRAQAGVSAGARLRRSPCGRAGSPAGRGRPRRPRSGRAPGAGRRDRRGGAGSSSRAGRPGRGI